MHSRRASRRSLAHSTTLALGAGLLIAGGVSTPFAQADDPPQDPIAGALTADPADTLFPNQGNGGYDALHYDVDLTVDVAISGTANAVSATTFPAASTTVRAVTTGAPLSSYSFDFQGSATTLANATLNVDTVTVNGQPATFSRIENTTTSNATTDNHKLIVTPAAPVSGAFTTVVTYSGTPVRHVDTDGSSEGWNNTTDGATFVNQPVGAMTAFPHNNTPRDKATYTFTINAPSKLATSATAATANPGLRDAAVVSNGELVSRTPNGDGSRTTWVWNQAKQMASELSLISIGRYDMYTSDITLASGRTIPEWTFIDPAISVANQTTTLSTRAQLKAVLDFFESKFGPYPGNSTGLVTDVVPSAINYALETQDRSFFPNSASRGTTYHELMHQWWGNSVAPYDWNDIVLNEGPAKYSEYQFPYEGGGSSTTTTEQANFALYTSRASTHSTFSVAPAAMTQASQLFGTQSYERGSIALEALRTSIGAADFETLMRQYQLTYGGGQAIGRRTLDFQALAEQISGRNLTAFFNTWYYTSGKPAWPAKYNLNLAGPTTQVDPGDPASYVLSVRNTGKVAMASGNAVVTVDLADVLDDAAIGTLPANTTLDGTTLTWTVPATALASTSTVTIPVTVSAGTGGNRLRAVARATTLGSTCLACAPSLLIGTAPISPAPVPTINGGTPTVAAPLSAGNAGWAAGTEFSYQWFVDGTPVPGATSATYTPDGNVVGFPVTVQVTGTLPGFNTTSQTSAATANGVRAALLSPTPTITGAAAGGSPLTVNPGAWEPGTVFTYQWFANGSSISGATGPVYTPAVASQVGQTLTASVTGTKFGYTTTTRTSAATAPVVTGTQTRQPTPTISGVAQVGTVLTAVPGTWDVGTTLSYEWSADGTPISGATAATFTPTAAQLGQVLTVLVTSTKPAVFTVYKTSNPTPAVIEGVVANQTAPTITGVFSVGSVLTANPGTWTPSGVTFAYQWYANGQPIANATQQTFTPTASENGKFVLVAVTGSRAGYTSASASSASSRVTTVPITNTVAPAISGTPSSGQTLSLSTGSWNYPDLTFSYQWYANGAAVRGASGPTYVVPSSALGKTITGRVTASRPGSDAVAAFSSNSVVPS